MAYSGQISKNEKLASGAGAVLVVAAIGYLLGNSFALAARLLDSDPLAVLSIATPPPMAPPQPDEAQSSAANGAASAANQRAQAAPGLAIQPKLLPISAPVIAAAPLPDKGRDPSSGATPTMGPGTGAGGQGSGSGSGSGGSGLGGGTRPIHRSGEITDSDYPRDATRDKVGGDVEMRFTVEPSGRVTECRVTRSSGQASLDRTSCRLIEARFRFKPATNGAGDPIASEYGWRQSWWLERRR